jgi:hypothetical protein
MMKTGCFTADRQVSEVMQVYAICIESLRYLPLKRLDCLPGKTRRLKVNDTNDLRYKASVNNERSNKVLTIQRFRRKLSGRPLKE